MSDCPYGCDECDEFDSCPYDDEPDDEMDTYDYDDPTPGPQCQECIDEHEQSGEPTDCALCPLGGMDPYDDAYRQADIAAHDPDRQPGPEDYEPPVPDDTPF